MDSIPPEYIIWHYTSAEVLVEFLKDDSFFYGTHYKFLNDGKEIEYGRKLFSDCLAEVPELKQYAQQLLGEDISPFDDVFVMCFSHMRDDLYQWRSYTPNGGYAIGFLMQGIDKSVRDFKEKNEPKIPPHGRKPEPYKDIRLNFFNCLYGEEKNRTRIIKNIKDIFQPIPEIQGHDEFNTQRDQMHIQMLKSLRDQSIWLYKHSTFTCENEMRIGTYGYPWRKKIEFIGNKPRVPLFPVDKSAIVEIMVSPHGKTMNNQILAELLRDRYDLNYKITRSQSPYIG